MEVRIIKNYQGIVPKRASGGGRKEKYPFSRMEVNDVAEFVGVSQQNLSAAIHYHVNKRLKRLRTKPVFVTRTQGEKVLVFRVK